MNTSAYISKERDLVGRRCMVQKYGQLCSIFIQNVNIQSSHVGVVFDGTVFVRDLFDYDEVAFLLFMNPRRTKSFLNKGDIFTLEFEKKNYDVLILQHIKHQGDLKHF